MTRPRKMFALKTKSPAQAETTLCWLVLCLLCYVLFGILFLPFGRKLLFAHHLRNIVSQGDLLILCGCGFLLSDSHAHEHFDKHDNRCISWLPEVLLLVQCSVFLWGQLFVDLSSTPASAQPIVQALVSCVQAASKDEGSGREEGERKREREGGKRGGGWKGSRGMQSLDMKNKRTKGMCGWL